MIGDSFGPDLTSLQGRSPISAWISLRARLPSEPFPDTDWRPPSAAGCHPPLPHRGRCCRPWKTLLRLHSLLRRRRVAPQLQFSLPQPRLAEAAPLRSFMASSCFSVSFEGSRYQASPVIWSMDHGVPRVLVNSRILRVATERQGRRNLGSLFYSPIGCLQLGKMLGICF